MSQKITVYTKPTCSKCREVDKILRDAAVDYEKIEYYVTPLTEKKLRELLTKMGMAPRELLRRSESTYKEMSLADSSHSDAQLIKLMIDHPELMQRPIVEMGDEAVLGRPVENIDALLKKAKKKA